MNTWMATLVPYIHALGWSLLHFLWQGALIGLLYVLLRGNSSNSVARHRLGMFCLIAMLACPLITLAWLWPEPGAVIAASTAMSSSVMSAAGAASSETGLPASLERLLPWGVGLWLLGVCVIALRSFLHWRHLARIVRSATSLPRDWQLRLIELSQRFGILRPVRLLSSVQVMAPTLIGWLKPTILLPASLLSGFTPAQIELILAHELAHVRRFDYIANLIQVVIETLLFYHPAVHWICSDVRQQREQCCDDLVLSVGGGQRLAYARTLADLEEWIQGEAGRGFGTAMPALGAGGGVLLTRVQRIVDPLDAQRALSSRGGGFTLPMLVACAGLLLALLRLNAPSAEALGAALVRASATSAELLAVATFQIRSNAPVLSLQTTPAITIPQLPRVVERGAESTVPPPQTKTADVAVPRAVATPTHEEIPAPPITAPSKPAIVAEPAAATVVKTEAPSAPAVVKDPSPAPAAAASTGPQAVRVVQPTYPLDALRNNVAGKVDLEFRIGEDGHVRDVRVLSAEPVGVFDQAAILALRQWRFEPAPTSTNTRYTRSFAFTRGVPPGDTCRELTGSHICRRAASDGASN